MSKSRRNQMLIKLENADQPIIGSDLADYFGISRQVVVQDIAILRAQGHAIIATSNGYMINPKSNPDQLIKTIVSTHEGVDLMREELEIIVDYGGKIINVIVEHPVYGEITGTLMIKSKEDIDRFMRKVIETEAKPLAVLTEGEHIHTIEVPSEKIYELMLLELKKKGFIKKV